MSEQPDDPVFMAAVDMVRRTGALEFQIRYNDEPEPTVWLALVRHNRGADGKPAPESEPGDVSWTTAAGLTPRAAVLRLAEDLIDGGECEHCHRPTGIVETFDGMPLDDLFCWYEFDPELATFRRGCEGT